MADFVGRRRELKELREDIARTGLDTLSGRKAKAPRARVLLVAGRPGSGRTALAEAFVQEIAEEYPDGVLRTRLTTPAGPPWPPSGPSAACWSNWGAPPRPEPVRTS